MQKLLLVYYHSENRATSQIWKVFPNMVFPPIWGGEKMAAFWACACKLPWTLLSPARVQPLYGAGRKESSGTGLAMFWFDNSHFKMTVLANYATRLTWSWSAEWYPHRVPCSLRTFLVLSLLVVATKEMSSSRRAWKWTLLFLFNVVSRTSIFFPQKVC